MDWGVQLGSTYFNSLDVILFAIILIGGLGGALVGFIQSLSKAMGYLVGIAAGFMFTIQLSDVFAETFSLSPLPASIISFLVLFLIGCFATRLLGHVLDEAIDTEDGGPLCVINRLLGFFWGCFLAFLILGAILLLLQHQHLFDMSELLAGSQIYNVLMQPFLPGAVAKVKEGLS